MGYNSEELTETEAEKVNAVLKKNEQSQLLLLINPTKKLRQWNYSNQYYTEEIGHQYGILGKEMKIVTLKQPLRNSVDISNLLDVLYQNCEKLESSIKFDVKEQVEEKDP